MSKHDLHPTEAVGDRALELALDQWFTRGNAEWFEEGGPGEDGEWGGTVHDLSAERKPRGSIKVNVDYGTITDLDSAIEALQQEITERGYIIKSTPRENKRGFLRIRRIAKGNQDRFNYLKARTGIDQLDNDELGAALFEWYKQACGVTEELDLDKGEWGGLLKQFKVMKAPKGRIRAIIDWGYNVSSLDEASGALKSAIEECGYMVTSRKGVPGRIPTIKYRDNEFYIAQMNPV